MSLGTDGIPAVMNVTPTNAGNGGNCGGGWGGEWSSWIIIFLIFAMFSGWGNGFGGWGGNNAGMQGALTRGDLCNEFSFNDLQNGVRNINDSVNVGFANLNSTICHQQYDTAMQTNAIQAAVNGGFSALNSTICQQQYDTAAQLNGLNNTVQQGFNTTNVAMMQGFNAAQAQAADCCCKTQTNLMQLGNQIERGICQTNYNDATNTNAIIQNAHNDTDRVLARLDAIENARKDETIASLRQQLQTADFAASQAAQNNYLVNQLRPCPIPSYITCNPWASQAPYGSCGSYNNGCGCGCNG